MFEQNLGSFWADSIFSVKIQDFRKFNIQTLIFETFLKVSGCFDGLFVLFSAFGTQK